MKIEELRNKMCIPADASKDDIAKTFEEIADILLLHSEIAIGESTRYTIEEIEFYYFREGCFNEPEYYCTYPRKCNACSFFWHYSGVDICFESTKKSFGGVLIRSLKKREEPEENALIGGPMRCAIELANACFNEGCIMQLIVNEHKIKEGAPKTTIRQGIKADYKVRDEKKIVPINEYCYYIPQENNPHWIRSRINVCELIKEPLNEFKKKVIIKEKKTDYYKDNPQDRDKMLHKEK